VRDLKPHHVKKWSNGKSKRGKVVAMKGALNWAAGQGYIPYSPIAKANPEGKLFRNTRGQPWTANAVRCRFRRLEDKVGRRWTQSGFRHTWIARKLAAGVDSHNA
jgi:hypothetical protein